jgi:hypothetical protein
MGYLVSVVIFMWVSSSRLLAHTIALRPQKSIISAATARFQALQMQLHDCVSRNSANAIRVLSHLFAFFSQFRE